MTLDSLSTGMARCITAAFAFACLAASPVFAQGTPGTAESAITDAPSGAAAANADTAGAGEAASRTRYLNPVIERLAKGQPFIGVSTGNLSSEHAKALARAPIDYVYIDFEHNPMDFGELHRFSLATIDRAGIHERGNLQSDIALFARFPPYGREQVEWISKQALDLGLMGIIFNSISTAEEAELAVRSMRYPQARDSELPEPAGLRGWSPDHATWLWGIPSSEYAEVADVWPLNPDGELLAIMMIETAQGLENVDAIAATPGVGALFVGPSDLSRSMGVPSNSPEIEEALGTILAACLAHDVACGKSFSAEEIPGRIEDGWMMLNLGGADGGLGPDNAAALEAAEGVIPDR
ncbi:hypothetical protein KTN05_17025 [Paracoccus sp. Z118]|uniref:HpcH/HpaI aldolase family protein n=1 Tax=Paracoccus sp. Z118 TaxID=2851017 RepID=UPI001C2B8D70|nr:aldolase/citrate lyase family protein [Paracoccus sp. Z118]MBV0893494.1 hypothetical protein [Paracoccus sp. Z118]